MNDKKNPWARGDKGEKTKGGFSNCYTDRGGGDSNAQSAIPRQK